MADCSNMIMALAALVTPLVIAYLLTGWTSRLRLPQQPKAESKQPIHDNFRNSHHGMQRINDTAGQASRHPGRN